MDDKVSTAVKAVQGQVWSQKHGVMLRNLDRLDEELAEIKEEQAEKQKAEMKNQQKGERVNPSLYPLKPPCLTFRHLQHRPILVLSM